MSKFPLTLWLGPHPRRRSRAGVNIDAMGFSMEEFMRKQITKCLALEWLNGSKRL